MSNTARVRLTTIKSGDSVGIRASTVVGGKTLTADGSDEKSAIGNLKVRVANYEKLQEFRAEYPKTVEIDL